MTPLIIWPTYFKSERRHKISNVHWISDFYAIFKNKICKTITPTQFHFPFAARQFNNYIAHNCLSLSFKELDKLATQSPPQPMWELRDKHKQSSSHLLLLLELWPNGCIGPFTSEQEENHLYTTPTASSPSSSRFLWWNRPRPCNWDICRKQVTHSGMCVAWHRPLQLWDWSHSSGFLVKADRLQASDSSHRNLCLQTDTAETVNQSLFLLRLGLWQMCGRSSCVAAAPNASFHVRCFNSHSQILKPCFIGNQWPKELKLRL